MSRRCYTVARLLEELDIPRRTFYELLAKGELPFLEEIQPRIGRHARYRADLIDRYLANQWRQARPMPRKVPA